MTYGVYSEDLHGCALEDVSLETAKKYLHEGYVVCSERKRFASFEIRILFHKWRGFSWHKWDEVKRLGFVSIGFRTRTYNWADKIVARAVAKEKEANNANA